MTAIHEGRCTCSYLVKNGFHRFVARVAYDGTRFRGFQEQSEEYRTVQGSINSKLSELFNSRVKTVGASRTDLGVHARGQVIHFDLPPGILTDFDTFEYKINRLLPEDVKMYNVTFAPYGKLEQEKTDDIFHATKSAEGKLYTYRFCTNNFVDPLYRQQYAHMYKPMDFEKLTTSLRMFVGTHDFRSFCNRLEKDARDNQYYEEKKALSTIRTVRRIEMYKEGIDDGYYRIDFEIESALYRMIRNIVGSCMAVATDDMTIETLTVLLKDGLPRTENKAKSAVALGLCLEKVLYRNY